MPTGTTSKTFPKGSVQNTSPPTLAKSAERPMQSVPSKDLSGASGVRRK